MKCFSSGFLTRILSPLLICSMLSVSLGSAANARFISPDTMDPTIPGVGTNRYAYAGNDPANNSDPNGHIFGFDDAIAGIALGIATAVAFFSGTKEANGPGANDKISNTSDGQQMLNMTVGAAGGTLVGKAAGAAAQEVFGKRENQKQLSETTEALPTTDVKIPGRVQSRINLEKNGWQHVLDRHFSDKSASQFSLSREEVRSLLQEKATVGSPVTKVVESTAGPRFVRNVETGRIIGYDKFNNFAPTSRLTVMTDGAGNLVTAFPGAF